MGDRQMALTKGEEKAEKRLKIEIPAVQPNIDIQHHAKSEHSSQRTNEQ
ncbi:MAG: hypothetical protein AAGC93_31610 [Cyanobacteria bacterium P01_F01_bin.53]